MALHTRGNQPSKQRTLNTVDDSYTIPTTNEDVENIIGSFTEPRHNTGMGNILTGHFCRCVEEIKGCVKENLGIVRLLKDHYEDVVIPTPAFRVIDLDGNIYTYVTIGTQQWMVENFRGTQYSDTVEIPTLADDGVSGLVTGFTNGPSRLWDTFSVTGTNITSAVEALGSFADSCSNDFNLIAGDVLYIRYTLVLNSGVKPDITLYKSGVPVAQTTTLEGTRRTSFDIYNDGTYSIGLTSGNTGTDCSCDFIDVYTSGWINDITGACCSYGNTPSYINTYGLLYNWYAVNSDHAIAGDGQFTSEGVPSTGWRVPSSSDWDTLAAYLGGQGGDAGGRLKEEGVVNWTAPNTGATNSEGFTAVPGGIRALDGSYSSIGDYAFYHSSTEASTTENNSVYLYYNSDNIWLNVVANKAYGMSVKMVRDI